MHFTSFTYFNFFFVFFHSCFTGRATDAFFCGPGESLHENSRPFYASFLLLLTRKKNPSSSYQVTLMMHSKVETISLDSVNHLYVCVIYTVIVVDGESSLLPSQVKVNPSL